MMAELWEPFTYEFFRNGLLVATLAGALCGMIGTFVVLRNMSYIGHGLSHAVFGGAAASALVGVSFYVGAGVWGLVTALAIARVSRRGRLGADSIIGVVTTASFAFGVVLLNLFGTTRRSIDAVLFGSILGITTLDVLGVVAVAVASAAVVFFGYRTLVFSTFDPEVAEASGIRTGRADALLMAVIAVAVLTTMGVLGVVLVSAALVIPAATARLVTDRFSRMLVLGTLLGGLTGAVGMVLGYHLDVSSGAAIVLVAAGCFAVAYLARARTRRPVRTIRPTP
jgi:manganese/iron transport system permease protein/iron/zinc/copper transport system permease protein